MRGAALLLLPLVVVLLLLLLHAARGAEAAGGGGKGSCARSCGRMKVPYPFGFSPGCTIPLGCNVTDNGIGTAWVGKARELGLLVRNVTPRALILDLRPNCSRPLNRSLGELFTPNYAPSKSNGLLLSSCGREAAPADRNCTVPPRDFLAKLGNCAANESFGCLVSRSNASAYLERSAIHGMGCGRLVSSASYADASGPALLLGALELDWWVEGQCRCSSRATCTPLTAPTTRHEAFRCECPEGFEGDGFIDGAGCRRAIIPCLSLTTHLIRRVSCCLTRIGLGAIGGADTDEYRSFCILLCFVLSYMRTDIAYSVSYFVFFSLESESNMDSIRYTFIPSVFTPSLRWVGQKLSAPLTPLIGLTNQP